MKMSREKTYKRRIADLQTQLKERDQRIAALEKQVAELLKINTELAEQVAKLTNQVAKLSKNSSNSSKPPSSDIVKPPRKIPNTGKRKKGAQPGHAKYERKPFPLEEIDNIYQYEYIFDVCPDCGYRLAVVPEQVRVIQQMEVIEEPIRIDEHRGLVYWCEHCQTFHYVSLPPEVEKAGLVGPRLTALVAYMKSVCHASFSTIRKFLRDVIGVTISRGQLSKLVQKASKALQRPYEELLARLSSEARLNVDETGHKDNGKRFWTWCFCAETYVLFKIAGTRGSQVLFDILGKEFDGVLGCDYFSAYRKYMKNSDVLVQFCLAHLIRDLKFLTTLSHKATVAYGQRLLAAMKEMFSIFHQREQMGKRAFDTAMQESRELFLTMALINVPETNQAQNLAHRFREHGDAYFRFITTPGIEPTNNLAEQAIRFIVIDRHITQGTRSENGRAWCERIWTVLATCSSQSRSAFDYISQSIQAYFSNQPAPSLLGYP